VWFEAPGQQHVEFGNDTGEPARVLVVHLTDGERPVITLDGP